MNRTLFFIGSEEEGQISYVGEDCKPTEQKSQRKLFASEDDAYNFLLDFENSYPNGAWQILKKEEPPRFDGCPRATVATGLGHFYFNKTAGRYKYFVECDGYQNCKNRCVGMTEMLDTPEGAVEAWNRRMVEVKGEDDAKAEC